VIIAVAQYLAAVYIVFNGDYFGDTLLRKDLFILVLATIFIAAGGNIINDYFDVKIDGVNKPKKLIIDNYIKRLTALVLHLILTTIGVLLGSLLSSKILLICVLTSLFLWLYSYQFKRKPLVGNVLISLLTATAVYFPALLNRQFNQLMLFFAVFAFFVSLIREIIKDIEDVKGDGLFACQTLPLLYGMRTTKRIVIGITLLFIGVLLGIGLFSNNTKLLLLCIGTIVALTWFIQKLLPADTKKEFSGLSRYCKWLMLVGVLSMMIL
jgi:4-hydroxybenzoate polyprenyltransferase